MQTSNICLTATHAIQQIASPLFDSTGLNFFSYARDFDRNRSISLQTENELFYAWFESKNPYCSSITPDGVYDWRIIQNQQLQEHTNNMNFGNGIQIFKRHDNFSEIITLAAPSNMNVLQFYINNTCLINRFILYFKDRAAKYIKEAMSDPITLPDEMISIKPIIEVNNNNSLKEKFKIDTFYFNDKNVIKLSKRELECLGFYLKGLTSSQISSIMHVKKVTTDTFIRNIKNKFNCPSKTELFEKFWELDIIKTNDVF